MIPGLGSTPTRGMRSLSMLVVLNTVASEHRLCPTGHDRVRFITGINNNCP